MVKYMAYGSIGDKTSAFNSTTWYLVAEFVLLGYALRCIAYNSWEFCFLPHCRRLCGLLFGNYEALDNRLHLNRS